MGGRWTLDVGPWTPDSGPLFHRQRHLRKIFSEVAVMFADFPFAPVNDVNGVNAGGQVNELLPIVSFAR